MILGPQVPGNTPIDDISGLIPQHITRQDQLNEWESANILVAERKFFQTGRRLVFDEKLIKQVHKAMFNETWKWAGTFRKKDLNIGVKWHNIPVQVRLLVDDLQAWEKSGKLDVLSRAIRLHHRLAKIHPFLNGNGRHSRLMGDIYIHSRGETPPKWPASALIDHSNIRQKYIAALKLADSGDYSDLEHFVRVSCNK